MKTHAGLRIWSSLLLGAAFTTHSNIVDGFRECQIHLAAFSSLMHSDSVIRLEKRLFVKLILCLRLQEILLYYLHNIDCHSDQVSV